MLELAEALSALCNGETMEADPAITLGWVVCLSVTMVTGDLHCLWNIVY